MTSVDVVVVAAGSGSRFGGPVRKVAAELGGVPIVVHAMRRLEEALDIGQSILVAHSDDLDLARNHWQQEVSNSWSVIAGGSNRSESVRLGVAALEGGLGVVAIHDAARPLVGKSDLQRVVEVGRDARAAILASRVVETVKRVEDGRIVATEDRSLLWRAETPQVFDRKLLIRAHEASPDGHTDDAALVEALGHEVRIVESHFPNPKITGPADLAFAEHLVAQGLCGP